MQHQVSHQCRRLLLGSVTDAPLTRSLTTFTHRGQGQNAALRHCRHQLASRTSSLSPKFLSTSTAAASNIQTVSPDNILRSHLPDVDIPTNVSFHEYMFKKFDEYKDLTAAEEFLTGRSYTYAQLKENSIKVASALHRLGYRKGDVLLSFTVNHIDISVLMLACASLGVWYSAANPSFTPEELSRQLNDSGSLAVFTIPPLAGVVKEALQNKEFPNKVKRVFVFGEAEGCQPFKSLLEDDGKAFPDVDINPVEDVYTLPYSSGTTGLPKGVMLTHHNILANCIQMANCAELVVGERALALLPLYHIYGMVAVQYSLLQSGGTYITLPKFEPESFLKCLQGGKIELAHLVPPLVTFLAKHPVVSKFDLSGLRRVISAAAPLGEDLTRDFVQRFPKIKIAQGFGLTETSPATNLDMSYAAPGSIGTMLVNTYGKIYDLETGKTLGCGELGEYCVKGPQVMKGYHNNKKATDDMISPDGWLHTGDIGYFTEDGKVYIKDRLKELIKYKGSQVAPAELEALLLGREDINDVAVIGVPDDEAGELPKAFVVKRPGSEVSEEDIIKFVEEKMAPTKRLRGGVQFVDEIPRNPSGKILRRVIKEMYMTLAKA